MTENEQIITLLSSIDERLTELTEVTGWMEGFVLFFVVALICWLVYRFFRIFF